MIGRKLKGSQDYVVISYNPNLCIATTLSLSPTVIRIQKLQDVLMLWDK